jgi:chemotaxis protein methyltransferase CheR
MTPSDFTFICQLVRDRSCIVLEPGKEYLVESRLLPIVRELQLPSISGLVEALRRNLDNGLASKVIEAMVTNETSFFRDIHPYEAFKKQILPALISRRQATRRLNIWSAACSSGQEPYSLAILLKENFPELAYWSVNILATDLSNEILEKARKGIYNQIEVNRGLPAAMLARHFTQHGMSWQISDEIRRMVEFREMNLSRFWPLLPQMDIVLLRNVMIYFEADTKKVILARVANLLQPDGYLLLGGAETTLNLSTAFQRVDFGKVGFYQLISRGASSGIQ